MLVPKNRNYKRGSGLMDTAASLLTSALTSEAVKEAGTAAATTAGRKLGEVAVNKLTDRMRKSKPDSDPKHVEKARSILRKHLAPAASTQASINTLIDGSGHGSSCRPEPCLDPNKAIAIQDLVRRLNGGGLKST